MYTKFLHILITYQKNIFKIFRDQLLIVVSLSSFISLVFHQKNYFKKSTLKVGNHNFNILTSFYCKTINFKFFETTFAAFTGERNFVIFMFFAFAILLVFYCAMMESKYELQFVILYSITYTLHFTSLFIQ